VTPRRCGPDYLPLFQTIFDGKGDFDGREFPHFLDDIDDLAGEFAGWGDADCLDGVSVVVYSGEHGEDKGCCFACPGLRLSDHIAGTIVNADFWGEYGLETRRGRARSWTLDGFWNFMAYIPFKRFGCLASTMLTVGRVQSQFFKAFDRVERRVWIRLQVLQFDGDLIFILDQIRALRYDNPPLVLVLVVDGEGGEAERVDLHSRRPLSIISILRSNLPSSSPSRGASSVPQASRPWPLGQRAGQRD
jgi:hypothetical protein